MQSPVKFRSIGEQDFSEVTNTHRWNSDQQETDHPKYNI